jgi:hypothetical protein
MLTKPKQKDLKCNAYKEKKVHPIIFKSKHKRVFAVYGQNGDCFHSHVAGRSVIGPILLFHVEFLTWMAPLDNLFSPESKPHTTKIGRGHTENEQKKGELRNGS